LITEADGVNARRPRSVPRCVTTSTRRRLSMPEIRSKSARNPHHSPTRHNPLKRRGSRSDNQPPGSETACCVDRRSLFKRLTEIQINTAGLSGPYRSAEETMERVIGSHSAVRQVRRVLRRSLVVPRKGQLWELLVAASLSACGGDIRRAARLPGASVQQVRRAVGQREQTQIN